jgi:hypothetical protein
MRVLEDCYHIALTCVYYYGPLQVLPQHLQEDIVNRLEDAVHIARVKCVCKSFQYAANRVRSLRIICKEAYHARVRELPRMVLPPPDPKRRHGRGGDRGTLSSSQAGAAADGLALGKQRTENDFTPNVPLPPTTQNSPDTPGSGVHLQESQVDSKNNKHPREKVAEVQHADALHEVIPTGINVRRPTTRCQQEEDQSDVKICNWQQPSNQNSSDQPLQNTSSNFVTYKEGPQETLRDDNGNRVPLGSTKKWKLQRDLSLLQAGEASTSVIKEEPDTCKGQHLQETLRDNNGNLLDRCSKKLKCEGRSQAGDSQAGEVSMSVMKEARDTCKGPLQETLKGDHGNFLDRRSKKPEHEGEFRLGDLHSGEASMSVMKEERDTYEKGHLQEMLRDDNGNFLDGSRKKPKHEGEFCGEDPWDGETSTVVASREPIKFRHIVPTILRETECVTQLRLEIEPNLQLKVVPPSERKESDHWLTDPLFVKTWIPSIQATLQHLCIVDYNQQAFSRRSNLVTILSETCSVLKTLDLSYMRLDMKGCKDMPCLTSFTLRRVLVSGDALQEINTRMTNLQTLALLDVGGVQEGHLTFPELKILCLWLSKKAKLVKVDLPNLTTLQLKMTCPEALHVNVPTLKFLVFNLEVLDCSLVGFEKIRNLKELLYSSSNFMTLSKLVPRNVFLDTMFLDIPCLGFAEDGKLLHVLKQVFLDVPSFETLQAECPDLRVLNVGPGLWHSMETAHYPSLVGVKAWPPITRLILHMIPHTLAASVEVLLLFVTVMPKLQILEVKVHTDSEVDYDSFINAIKSHVAHLKFRPGKWTKTVNFSCFSF